MKPRRGIALLMLVVWLLSGISSMAEPVIDFSTPAPEEQSAPSAAPKISEAPLLTNPPISLDCGAALLVEIQSGQILFEQNADTPRAVASVTKIMTILLTLEAIHSGRIDLEDEITVSPQAAGMGGSQVLLDIGETQNISVLLKSVIVGSANDAAVALAETIYGSEELFVQRMNERAAELGMENTVFVNCTGLPAEGQHTTARDVAIMAMAMFSDSLYYEYSGIWLDEVDHHDGRVTQLTNTNKLIRLYDGCDGGKTGSTDEAGYCVAATAKRGDMRLIAVVLGAPTGTQRFDLAADMLDYGFANYRLYPVAQRGVKIRGELPVVGGSAEGVPLALDGDLTLLIEKGGEESITLTPDLPESIEAPVSAGQQVGSVNVLEDGRVIARIPVVAIADVSAQGLRNALRRIWENWLATRH